MEGHAKRIEFSSAVKRNLHIPQSCREGEVLEEQKNVGQASSLRTRVANERMTWDVANMEVCYALSYSDLTDGASQIILVRAGTENAQSEEQERM